MISSRFWPYVPYGGEGDPRANTTVELVHRPESPALVGVHVTQLSMQFADGKMTYGSSIGMDQTYWLDPSRNDAPVETDQLQYDQKGVQQGTMVTQFLQYAQLPDGRWYPTQWQWVYTNAKGKAQHPTEFRFFFAPGKTIDESWFHDPTSRFKAEDMSRGFGPRQAPTGIAAVPHVVAATATAAYRSAWMWLPWAVAVAVFGTAGVLLILQRRNQAPLPPLRGSQGPRRR
jgi:hypothetical protein